MTTKPRSMSKKKVKIPASRLTIPELNSPSINLGYLKERVDALIEQYGDDAVLTTFISESCYYHGDDYHDFEYDKYIELEIPPRMESDEEFQARQEQIEKWNEEAPARKAAQAKRKAKDAEKRKKEKLLLIESRKKEIEQLSKDLEGLMK